MRSVTMTKSAILILHNVRSAHNVGAMFRTADGAGVSKIYLAGYTPAPKDRFGRPQPEIEKTSLGAHQAIPWEQVNSIETLIAQLQEDGICVVAVEQGARAVPYYTLSTERPVAFIMGNEIEGVPEAVQALCDVVVAIPMSGMKESLNVATTAGIILFAYRDTIA